MRFRTASGRIPGWLGLGYLLICAALLLCGCVRIDIGDEQESPTIGEQLIDLQEAYDEGLISTEEFAELRSALLRLPFD